MAVKTNHMRPEFKRTRVSVYLTPDEKKLLDLMAMRKGYSRSKFILDLINDEGRRFLDKKGK